MSFFSSQSYKPQIRQEGFHLPSPTPSNTTPPPTTSFDSTNNIFIQHNFLPDAFRKFPQQSEGQPNSMDFTDELASLIANPQSTNHPSSHERSTHSPHSPNPIHNTPATATNQNSSQFDDPYRSSNNIFDISAQNHHPHSSTSSTSSTFPSHFSLPHRPSELPLSSHHNHHNHHNHNHHHHPTTHSLHDFTSPAHHFHSNIPTLNNNNNTAIRYDHHTDPQPPPPSSFPNHFRNKTPSPLGSRSRSGSRAPSVPPTTSVLGPTRTTRTRRNNSVSSTSPPPHPHNAPRPQAIVIPPSHRPNGTANGPPPINGHGQPMSPLSLHNLSGTTNAWYIPSHASHSYVLFSLNYLIFFYKSNLDPNTLSLHPSHSLILIHFHTQVSPPLVSPLQTLTYHPFPLFTHIPYQNMTIISLYPILVQTLELTRKGP